MKYYLIAGEASGDLHASHLMQALRERDPEADFRCVGGDLMQAQGGTLVRHYRSLAYMGILPVLRHLPTILRGMKECRADVVQWRPDVLILVDYPGFNLGMARYAAKHLPDTRIFYYISPKLWAWKEYRIRDLRRYVHQVLSILPFEVDYFHRRHDFHRVTYVGNPTLDEVTAYEQTHPRDFARFTADNDLPDLPIVALLAGSRKQEIKDNLGRMLKAVAPLAGRYQFVVAGAPGIDADYYRQWLGALPVRVVYGQTYRLLQHSTAALVTSGTATLETALFRVPQVVCYYLNAAWFFRTLRRMVLKIPYISLVNLMVMKEVVSELVADPDMVLHARQELENILPGGPRRETMLRGYDEVARRLGEPGAPQHAAAAIVERSQ